MEDKIKHGERLFNAGDLEAAFSLFQSLVKQYPTVGLPYFYVAATRKEIAGRRKLIGDEKEKVFLIVADELRTAIKLGCTDPMAYRELAIIVQQDPVRRVERKRNGRQASFHESNRYLELLEREKVDIDTVHFFRGKNSYRLGNWQGAVKDLMVVLTRNKLHEDDELYLPLGWRFISRAYLRQKEYRKAIEAANNSVVHLKHLLCNEPEMERTRQISWRTRAEAHFHLGEYTQALGFLNDYLKIRKDKANMLLLRARINGMKERYAEVVTDCATALETRVDDEALKILEAIALERFHKGDHALALRATDSYVRVKKDNIRVWLVRARIHVEKGCNDLAVQDCLAVLQREEKHPEASAIMARATEEARESSVSGAPVFQEPPAPPRAPTKFFIPPSMPVPSAPPLDALSSPLDALPSPSPRKGDGCRVM